MAAFSDYATGGGGSVGTSSGADNRKATKTGYWSLAKCKKAYLDYLGAKRQEIEEQQDARRYRHGAQWTEKQIKALNNRKQPVVTFNRIGRKVDGIVGLVEKLRQDPKAFPRTPQHEKGAELGTYALNFVLDQQDWKAKSPLAAESGAVDGIGGLELNLVPTGQDGDFDVEFDTTDGDGFFYDPRSFRLDFSDARFMGMGKWVDVDTATEMFPGKADDIEASLESGSDLTSNSDRDNRWFGQDGEVKRIRLVDIWYKHGGEWCWCVFTGSLILAEGKSPFIDEKKKTFCKYIMYSAAVDHDGDRYGFIRNLKSAQDEVNQRRSKGLHELNSRRIIGEVGAFDDVEVARREAARPDGFVLRNKGFEAQFDDVAKQAAIEGQLRFLEDAKAEIENFGPNPALVGDNGIKNRSGRAIALMQEAGIAELGPYILAYRGWKLRVYRAIWNAIARSWTAERWIRVTDDQDVAQFIQINGTGVDPQTGEPTMINALGQLDVDIILDEGPDHINAMQDVYETLTGVLPSIAPMLTPAEARAAVRVLFDTAPLPASAKKVFRDATQQAQQPDPMQEQAKQLELRGVAAKVAETESRATLNMAKAQEAQTPEAPQMGAPQAPEIPMELQAAESMATIEDKHAAAALKRAQADKVTQETVLMPAKTAHEMRSRETDQQISRESEQWRADALAKRSQTQGS